MTNHNNGIERRISPPMQTIQDRITLLEEQIMELQEAFPDGPAKHREVHEAWIESKKAEKEFYDTLKQELLRTGIKGFFSLIVIILGLALLGLSMKLGLPIGGK